MDRLSYLNSQNVPFIPEVELQSKEQLYSLQEIINSSEAKAISIVFPQKILNNDEFIKQAQTVLFSETYKIPSIITMIIEDNKSIESSMERLAILFKNNHILAVSLRVKFHHESDPGITSYYRILYSTLQKYNMNSSIMVRSQYKNLDESLIHASLHSGGLILSGIGNIICIELESGTYEETYSLSLDILQAARLRINKAEFISCPSCGRTLFNLQETTKRIREKTGHLKGVKIAIMGCIVNGPGEMADADFGYVGAGPGKIHLYRGSEIVKKNIDESSADQVLIDLIKESNLWHS
jgi:(E)-4-hydroxy-3-methylbut-2-enyl-diphosphate synthase